MKKNNLHDIIKYGDISYYMSDGEHEECQFSAEVRKEFMACLDNLVLYKNFIFDIKRLSDEINFDCFNCYKINTNGCCNGAPNMFDKDVYNNLSTELFSIIKGRFSDSEISEMLKYGVMENYVDEVNEEIGRPLTYVGEDGSYKCSFLMTDKSGAKLCAIKNWCIDNDKSINEFCNFECLLFPLEIFVFKFNSREYILITSLIDKKIEPYCRWGVDDSTEFVCFNNCDRTKIPEGTFNYKDYIPISEAFEDLIIIWFGKDAYNKIEELVTK